MGDRWLSGVLTAAIGVCVLSVGVMHLLGGVGPIAGARPAPTSLEAATMDMYRDKPGDPELGELYGQLNARHFDGRLPKIKVIWAGDLDRHDIGDYRLNGMTDGSLILLKASLEKDRAETRRTLCHEMVHVKLITDGIRSTAHDAVFQKELRRLHEEGCFHAIRAPADEREELKRWIEAERARLEDARRRLDVEASWIERETERVSRLFEDLNERIHRANAAGSGWPSPDETTRAEREQAALNERIAAHNAAVSAHGAEQARFNQAVERYNLMLAYPDGLAEDRVKGVIR